MHFQGLQQPDEHDDFLVHEAVLENLLAFFMVVLAKISDARNGQQLADMFLKISEMAGNPLELLQIGDLVVLTFKDDASPQDQISQLFEVPLDREPIKGLGDLPQLLLISRGVVDELVDFFHCCLF